MTLQEEIRDLVQELNYLDLVTPPPDDAPIKKMVAHLVKVSQHHLASTMRQDDEVFADAAKAIDEAKKDIKEASEDIQKIGKAVKATADAVRLIDQAIGFVAPLL